MSIARIRVWHQMRRHWWYENDSNDAKGVTCCGITRQHIDVTGNHPPMDDPWCRRCFPYGKPEIIKVKTPAQLRALSGLSE